MEDLNAKYRKRFDEIYHDSDMLSYVGYNKESKKIEFMCKKHGLQSKEAYHLFNDRKGCKKCNLERFAENQTSNSEEFIEKAEKLNVNNLDDFSLVNYKKSNILVDIICHKVGFDGIEHGIYKITPNSYLNGRRCPKCAKNYHYTKEELVEKFKDIHGCNFLYDRVKEAKTHEMVEIGCKTHGYFMQMVSNHLKGQGCPLCKESKMEKEITELLAKKEIEFEREKRFDWLGRQSLDFYLPKYNIVIECQGIQHFEPLDYFGGKEEFERRKILDSTKSERCKENGIEIIYYADYDYDFPYEVIKDKNKLLSIILEKK